MKYAIRTVGAIAAAVIFASCTHVSAEQPEDIPQATGLSSADKLMFEIEMERMRNDEQVAKMQEILDKMQLPRGDAESYK